MSARPKVKICGVTNLEDARLAADLGAWAVGMVFYPESPRRCERAAAASIAGALRRRTEVCGVFVNAPLDEVVGMADGLGFSMVQLHGDEGPSFCDEVARRTGARVIKAMRVRQRADVQALNAFRRVDFHLLDAHADGLPGGTGESFDWELVRAHSRHVPLVLSGGLEPANVAAAIAATRPFAVDVASGVEAAPGRKDPERLAAFFDAVRAAAPETTVSS
jgi:phosphoribosylanthranilate isomerase